MFFKPKKNWIFGFFLGVDLGFLGFFDFFWVWILGFLGFLGLDLGFGFPIHIHPKTQFFGLEPLIQINFLEEASSYLRCQLNTDDVISSIEKCNPLQPFSLSIC